MLWTGAAWQAAAEKFYFITYDQKSSPYRSPEVQKCFLSSLCLLESCTKLWLPKSFTFHMGQWSELTKGISLACLCFPFGSGMNESWGKFFISFVLCVVHQHSKKSLEVCCVNNGRAKRGSKTTVHTLFMPSIGDIVLFITDTLSPEKGDPGIRHDSKPCSLLYNGERMNGSLLN